MGTARRLAGLAVVIGLGCSFDSGEANDTSKLGSDGTNTSPTSGETEGDDGTDAAGDGSGGGETSFGGSTSVGSMEACIDACEPPVPDGWNGPFYVADADNPIDCPEGYARQDLAYTGLQSPPPVCDCQCETGSHSCEVAYTLSVFGCPVGLNGTVGDGDCDGYDALGADVHMRASMAGEPASCVTIPVQQIEPVAWQSSSTFCAAPARGGNCEGDRCTAMPPQGVATRLCISMDGEQACPGGGYDNRTVLHRSYDDQRSCQGCSCSNTTGCTGQVFAHDSGSCGGAAQSVPFDSCTDLAVSGGYGVTASISGGGSCDPSPSVAMGETTATDPVTLCCTTS